MACTIDSAQYSKTVESDRVFDFLAGLNVDLDEVRGRILGKEPLPSTREAFAEVRRVRKQENGDDEEGNTCHCH